MDVLDRSSGGSSRTRAGPINEPTSRLVVTPGFELDVATRELRHNGARVHLRPREYALLAVLASNPGRAFTRRQLMDLAWGPRQAIGPRAIDVHVHWLRAKIELQPHRPAHLVSVRGIGYRLDPRR